MFDYDFFRHVVGPFWQGSGPFSRPLPTQNFTKQKHRFVHVVNRSSTYLVCRLYSSRQKEYVSNVVRIVRWFYLSIGQVWNNAISLRQSYRPICWKTKCVARTFSKANLSQSLMYVSRIIGLVMKISAPFTKCLLKSSAWLLCTLDLLQHGTTILTLNSPL